MLAVCTSLPNSPPSQSCLRVWPLRPRARQSSRRGVGPARWFHCHASLASHASHTSHAITLCPAALSVIAVYIECIARVRLRYARVPQRRCHQSFSRQASVCEGSPAPLPSVFLASRFGMRGYPSAVAVSDVPRSPVFRLHPQCIRVVRWSRPSAFALLQFATLAVSVLAIAPVGESPRACARCRSRSSRLQPSR